jgi:glycolate oxidase FAD binding subunit
MSADASAAGQINAALGANVASGAPEVLARHGLGGKLPAAAAFPETPEQAAAVLALADRLGWGVVPWGGGAGRAAGRVPARYDLALGTGRLNRLLDLDAENLTLTAEAGMTLAEANRLALPHHQCLPLGFGREARSLGGLVAANHTPPRRLLHGDLRDQLLGLRVATADGRLVRFGRKVIKNVAGYDMNKLYLGSAGMFGLIVELTFKLASQPDEEGALLGEFPDAAGALAAAAALYASALLPSFLFVLDVDAGAGLRAALGLPVRPAGWQLLAGFEGRGQALRRQLADTRALMARHGARQVETLGPLPEAAGQCLEQPAPGGAPAALRLRLGMAAADLAPELERLPRDAATLGVAAACVADYGSGRLLAGLSDPAPGRVADVAHFISAWRARVTARQGYLAVQAAPDDLRARVHPWGDAGGDFILLCALKAQLDPRGTLSPGRFL